LSISSAACFFVEGVGAVLEEDAIANKGPWPAVASQRMSLAKIRPVISYAAPNRTGGADRQAVGGRRQWGKVHVTPWDDDRQAFASQAHGAFGRRGSRRQTL